jgi:hypothetical protein
LPEPWTHGDTHQEKARPDNGREHGDCKDRAPRHDGGPDLQRDKLRDAGAHQKIHGEVLHESEPLPGRGRADNDAERHDPRRHRKPEAHSVDET